MPSTRELGRRICAARAYAGLSRRELALLLGCHPDHLSRLEHGAKRVTPEQLEAVAEACRVPIQFLRLGFHYAPREPRRARPHRPPRGELIA